MPIHKSGYAAIIGRPNVGKSTLLNQLVGEKVSIVTSKPQTTRWQILGIKTTNDAQIIYIDTPGIHQDQKYTMNRYMNRVAKAVIADADVILFMVDALRFKKEDELILDQVKTASAPVVLVINKIDLLKNKSDLLPYMDQLKNKMNFAKIIPLSARSSLHIPQLESEIIQLLKEGPAIFPEDQFTDQSIKLLASELIREQLIKATEEELPYATAVEIEQFKETDKLTEISAVIWVERPGQKIIVIGKKGERLKSIGTKARKQIERMLGGQKVFLRLWVKVKPHWTDNSKALRNLGYQ